jgi:hypothetical protein
MRGLLLDLLTTGERERVEKAFSLYMRTRAQAAGV